MMYKAVHPRDDIDRLYVSREKAGKGICSFEECVDASIRGLEDYIKERKERQITKPRNVPNNIRTNRYKSKESKQHGNINRK